MFSLKWKTHFYSKNYVHSQMILLVLHILMYNFDILLAIEYMYNFRKRVILLCKFYLENGSWCC